VVCENNNVEEKDTYDNGSGNKQILVNTKDQKAQSGQDIFYGEEVHVSIVNQEIHKGVDFPGSSFNMEDREVSVQNAEQDNEEEGEQEVRAIEVDIHMGFPVRLSPNPSTATEVQISAGGTRWLLASIPHYSSILFGFNHFSPSDLLLQKRFQSDDGPLKGIQRAELNINPFGHIKDSKELEELVKLD
jgi:hypothetical protein